VRDGAGFWTAGAETCCRELGAGTGCAADGAGAGCEASGAGTDLAEKDVATPVVQVIDPTVNVKPASNFMEAGKETIWIVS
jgi:hypothetical protein